jgi:hypothetical protein
MGPAIAAERPRRDGKLAFSSNSFSFALQTYGKSTCICIDLLLTVLLEQQQHHHHPPLQQGNAVTTQSCLPPYPSRRVCTARSYVKLPSESQRSILASPDHVPRQDQVSYDPARLFHELLASIARFRCQFLANLQTSVKLSTLDPWTGSRTRLMCASWAEVSSRCLLISR